MESYPFELLLIAVVSMLAPLVIELPKVFRLPVVVVEIIFGILIGPHVLNLAQPDGMIETLSELGLAFLLFTVGLEIKPDIIHGQPLALAIKGWVLSFVVAFVVMLFFSASNLIQTPPLLAAVALSTTALTVLAPILRDQGELDTEFGKYMVAAAAAGEFCPLIVISLIVIPTHNTVIHTLFILGFIVVALIAANIALTMRSSSLVEKHAHTMLSSGSCRLGSVSCCRFCLLRLRIYSA